MPKLEEKIKRIEEIIIRKDMPKEDKEKLLVEVGELREILKHEKMI